MRLGEAPPLQGRPFEVDDIVVRGTEVAVVTYVSETHDYAEVSYSNGFTFRTHKSEWTKEASDGGHRA